MIERLAIGRRGALRLECELAGSSAAPVRVDVGVVSTDRGAKTSVGFDADAAERTRLAELVGVVRIAVPLSRDWLRHTVRRRLPAARSAGVGPADRSVEQPVGRDTASWPVLAPDAQPEYACRYEPLVAGANGRGDWPPRALPAARGGEKRAPLPPADVATCRGIGPLERPLRLESPPCLLEVISVVPEAAGAVRMAWRAAKSRGPGARSGSKTGCGPHIGRDYYRVETTAGNRFWLFRCLKDGKWFLHGVFEENRRVGTAHHGPRRLPVGSAHPTATEHQRSTVGTIINNGNAISNAVTEKRNPCFSMNDFEKAQRPKAISCLNCRRLNVSNRGCRSGVGDDGRNVVGRRQYSSLCRAALQDEFFFLGRGFASRRAGAAGGRAGLSRPWPSPIATAWPAWCGLMRRPRRRG